jgi:hypothetical protein
VKKTAWALLALCLVAAPATAVDGPPDLEKRAKGARRVVLATVTDVNSAFGENEFGDRLILTNLTLRVDETMKGVHAASVVVTLEGGTVGDVTLTVSDMPQLSRGERAVLFLDDTPSGGHVPHGRGAGVLKVDADDRVAGTPVSLENIRAAVKAAQNGAGR